MLATKLQPARLGADQRKRFAQLVADLDHDDFRVRQKADAGLKEMGPEAELLLTRALKAGPPVEVQRRLEGILSYIRQMALPPEVLREVRAVEVLERLGGPEARRLLRDLAGGAPHARLTEEAAGALRRLGR